LISSFEGRLVGFPVVYLVASLPDFFLVHIAFIPFIMTIIALFPAQRSFFYSNPSVLLDVCIFITYNGEIDHE